MSIPHRKFGRYDEQVSVLCLGGYHIGSIGTKTDAIRLMQAAIARRPTRFA